MSSSGGRSKQRSDFSDDDLEKFMSWLNLYVHLGQTQMKVQQGGRSGARTWIVELTDPSAPVSLLPGGRSQSSPMTIPDGTYILKILLADKARVEYDHHQEVYEAASATAIKEHMPRAFGPFAPEERRKSNKSKENDNCKSLAAIFYTIAGHGFADLETMESALMESALEDIWKGPPIDEYVAMAADFLLNKWTLQSDPSHAPISNDHYQVKGVGRDVDDDYIEVIRRGLNGQNGRERLLTLHEDLNDVVLDPRAATVRVTFPGYEKRFLNPIPFVARELNLPGSEKQVKILLGQTHHDVHPGNLIIRNDKPLPGSQSWYVIDFANYRGSEDRVAALYDVAYLEIILLMRAYNNFATERQLAAWWSRERELLSDLHQTISIVRIAREVAGSKSQDTNSSVVDSPQNSSALAVVIQALDENVKAVLPIRGVLSHLSDRLGSDSNDMLQYSFLAASIEAGLDCARKLDTQRQKIMAYLTAVYRFDKLLRKLGIYQQVWDDYEAYSTTTIRRIPRIDLEAEISGSAHLFEPLTAPSERSFTQSLRIALSDNRDTARLICLTGSPLSGKTAYLRSISGDERSEKSRIVISSGFAPTEDERVTVSMCIQPFLDGLREAVRRPSGTIEEARNIPEKLAVAATMAKMLELKPLWCIDNMDKLIARLSEHSENGPVEFLGFITGLVEQGIAHVFITATDATKVYETANRAAARRTAHANSSDKSWWDTHCIERPLPNWTEQQIDESLDMFNPGIFLPFDNVDARATMRRYSGGFVYAMKFMIQALKEWRKDKPQNTSVSTTELEKALNAMMNSASELPLHQTVLKEFNNVYKGMDETEQYILTSFAKQHDLERVTVANLASEQYSTSEVSLEEGLSRLTQLGILRERDSPRHSYTWNVHLWKLYMEAAVEIVKQRKRFRIDEAGRRLYIAGAQPLVLSETQGELLKFLYGNKKVSSYVLEAQVFKQAALNSSDNVGLAIGWLNQRVQNMFRAVDIETDNANVVDDSAGTHTAKDIPLIIQDSTGINGSMTYTLNLEHTEYIPDQGGRRL